VREWNEEKRREEGREKLNFVERGKNQNNKGTSKTGRQQQQRQPPQQPTTFDFQISAVVASGGYDSPSFIIISLLLQ